MRMKMLGAALAAVVTLGAVPVDANDGYAFFGLGVAGNPSGDMVDVQQNVLPQVMLEWGYPISHSLSMGFEISPLFFQNHTQRWGSEFDFGVVMGGQMTWDINKRWFVTAGGGWVFSNPLSDDASGEYLEGYEDDPGAQLVRESIQPMYFRCTVGRYLNRNWAVQVGVRNTSPYVAIGYTSF